MNPKDREKEIIEYLTQLFDGNRYRKFGSDELIVAGLIVKAILARYELYDVEDEPRGE